MLRDLMVGEGDYHFKSEWIKTGSAWLARTHGWFYLTSLQRGDLNGASEVVGECVVVLRSAI